MRTLTLLLALVLLPGCIVFDKKSEAVSFHRFEAAAGAPTKAQPREPAGQRPPARRRPTDPGQPGAHR